MVMEERQAADRELALRPARGAARVARVPGPPVPLAGHRLDGRHRPHRPRRLPRVLPHLLRAGQRLHLRLRRRRPGRPRCAASRRPTARSRPGRRCRRPSAGEPPQRGERRAVRPAPGPRRRRCWPASGAPPRGTRLRRPRPAPDLPGQRRGVAAASPARPGTGGGGLGRRGVDLASRPGRVPALHGARAGCLAAQGRGCPVGARSTASPPAG